MTGDEIRKLFLQFFEERGHKVLPSSSLVPNDDPTLLFTSAGMVQIKPYFLGQATPPSRRLASCQKCFRTTDIDSVGDTKHLTFFEMLGNFSVGDYFKQEAINWAWEFVTRWLNLPPQRLWITIFLDDEAALAHWRAIGVPSDRIVRYGEKDNFWGPAGDSGPCGPCSEIHYDFGTQYGCGKADCGPSCSCSRFLEIWNLVFTQYDQDKEGRRTLLPRPNIDTGMGLERTAAVMQGKVSVYDTDLFRHLIDRVGELSGKRYGLDEASDRAIRIVAEHGRSITFLISDGVVPSNEGRGYVLRRVLRRAALFGRKLGIPGTFLDDVAEEVTLNMASVYHQLHANRPHILNIIHEEEMRFWEVVESGLDLVPGIFKRMEEQGTRMVSGEVAFHLYDTYGLPIEILAEVAGMSGFTVDAGGFNKALQRQRERARAAHRFTVGDRPEEIYRGFLSVVDGQEHPPLAEGGCSFVGYDRLQERTSILGLLVNRQPVETIPTGRDQEVEVILAATPFYGEMGGQSGDTGKISGAISGARGEMAVTSAFRPLPELTVHRGKVVAGSLSVGDVVEAEVDGPRRLDIARNHTATHLLQACLRQVLGTGVRQSGSLVAPERLRFDFTQVAPISQEQIWEIQRLVNEKIRQNLPVLSRAMSYSEAVARGATALFGEKYGEAVRVIEVGDPPFSMELCGGTHVQATGDIGFFHIISEGSIGAGMHRIEAVTGRGAESFVEQACSSLEAVAQRLQALPSQVEDKVSALLLELEKERKRAMALEQERARVEADSLLGKVESINGVNFLAAKLSDFSPESLRVVGDRLKEKKGTGVFVLGTVYNDKPSLVVMVSGDLVTSHGGLDAGQLVKDAARVIGGGGGGRKELGQGSGKDKDKLDEALQRALQNAKRQLQGR